MLSVFPDLLFLSFVAPFVLRVVLGGILFTRGVNLKGVSKPLALFHIVSGTLFIIGLFTQVVSLLLFIIVGLHVLNRRAFDEKTLLILAISLSLLFTGAGIWAIDLPL